MAFQTVLEFASLTNTGQVRTHNEDAVEVRAEAGFAVLADGMGGYNAGEVASRMCVETISQYLLRKHHARWTKILPRRNLSASRFLDRAVGLANKRIVEAAKQHVEYVGMGTTVVTAVFQEDRIVIAHVGDSRAYLLRQKQLISLTNDHSVIQAQIDAGLISEEHAQFSPIKNLITRAVGAQEEIETEIRDHQVQEGDLFLLCSDGLTDMLSNDQISEFLNEGADNLQACCQTLVDNANENGGRDNISVILIKVRAIEELGLMEKIFPG